MLSGHFMMSGGDGNQLINFMQPNMLLTPSDHFAQMVSVNREQIDSKKNQCVSERLFKFFKIEFSKCFNSKLVLFS